MTECPNCQILRKELDRLKGEYRKLFQPRDYGLDASEPVGSNGPEWAPQKESK